jgi:hypothetical protein
MAPRKVYPPVDPENQMQLRAVHASTPGVVNKPRAKRTSAEVTVDKCWVEEEKKQKLAKREAAILSVSNKENQMGRADKAADHFADHPPAKDTKKMPRARLQNPGEFFISLAIWFVCLPSKDVDQVPRTRQDGVRMTYAVHTEDGESEVDSRSKADGKPLLVFISELTH